MVGNSALSMKQQQNLQMQHFLTKNNSNKETPSQMHQ